MIEEITAGKVIPELDELPDVVAETKTIIRGDIETGYQLLPLTVWARKVCDKYELDVTQVCGWDDNICMEFWSWGHNSRWRNVFESKMLDTEEGVDITAELFKAELKGL